MDDLPDLSKGFVRISVRLPAGESYTPGEVAKIANVALDQLGPIVVAPAEALVDVRYETGRQARINLERLGPAKLVGWEWQWLKIGIGRNHGLSMGQLKKIMQTADAMPLGKISINNTHTLVGLQDFKLPSVIARLSQLRINGYSARPESLPPGKGPGNPAFAPNAR
ncbi:MAG: DbpA RNA binding domain-containing protein [Planctomycetes bacterium]|nr:DbpA RNA binding domain-containing protein [Planctomycetota bacterium]